MCQNLGSIELLVYKLVLFLWIRAISLMSKALTDGPGDLGSIPGRVAPKTLKMARDLAFLFTQYY